MSNELEAKWKIYREGRKFQLHKLNPDGTKGKAIGPAYDDREKALKYQRALYKNVPDVQESVEEISEENKDMQSQLILGSVRFEADTENPRFLRFQNAVLARAETNQNGDNIDSQGVRELANTIAGTPIDIDHSLIKNIGVYTAGRVGNNDELLVDGIIWLDRCDALNIDAQDIIDGKFKLSIEAFAETAECSYCHGIYQDSKAYCEHLISRAKFGAKRLMRKLQAIGGAITRRPAGTNTGFANGLIFVASHKMDEEVDDLFMRDLVSRICDQYRT